MILDFACPIPPAEEEEARLLALAGYGIVDTPAEAEFDRFVRLASELFEVPVAVISLVERDRQWFKAIVGLDASETERQVSFCGHAILSDDPLVVPNALEDPRFKGNPLVVGAPNIRFYAGAPLITPTGARLGTLCIIDDKPRSGFTDCQATLLADLAQLVMDRLELRKAEAERRISQERFRKIASTTPEAIVCADFEGTIQFWNEAAESIFGYLKEDALGRNVAMLVPEESQSAHQSGMERFVTGGTPRLIGQTREFMARRRDGDHIPIEMSLSSWTEGERVCFGAILRNIAERKRVEQELFQLAYYDSLTGLPNRRLLRQHVEAALQKGPTTTVLLLGLDRFREINDSLGHAAGDGLLKAVGERLETVTTGAKLVARFGADEFAVLSSTCASTGDAAALAERVMSAFADAFEIAGRRVRVGASIGIVMGSRADESVETLMVNADLALAQAKTTEVLDYVFFEEGLRQAITTRRRIEEELHRAFESQELELFYQPQVCLEERRIVGAEALLRWRHPAQGVLAPSAFLYVLEDSSLAGPVGDWAIETACAQGVAWRARGLPPVRIGVNLFGAQFRLGNLGEKVIRAIGTTGLPPEALELEITENILLQEDSEMIDVLRDLHRRGVGIAFDDYGTGYASLSLLKRYPLTRLKIDRSFVSGLQDDPDDMAIVKAVIALGKSLGLDVIAEGVETAAQEEILKAEGCCEIQGYLYGRPMPADDFAALLTKDLRFAEAG